MNAKHLTKFSISKKLALFCAIIAIAIIAAFSICATTKAKAESNVINNGEITVFNENLVSDKNWHSPIYAYYAEEVGSASQYIIPSEKLKSIEGATIKGLKYYLSDMEGQLPNHIFRAYIAEVGESTPSVFLDKSDAMVVFSGSVTFSPEMTITFDTPYTYKGGNLAIEFVCSQSNGNYADNYYYSEPIDNGTIYRNSLSDSPSSLDYAPKTTIIYSGGTSGVNISGHVADVDNPWQAVPGAFVQYCQWNPWFQDYVPVSEMSAFTDWFGNYTIDGVTEDMLPGVIRVYRYGYEVGESAPIWFVPEGMDTIYRFVEITPSEPPVPPTPPTPPDPPQPVPPTPVPPTPVDPGTNVPQTGDTAAIALAIVSMLALCGASAFVASAKSRRRSK